MPSNKQYPAINYTSRDFNSIKKDLVQYAKRYYSNTYKDFSEAGFGALMLDTVSYVGDILSFYLDYNVNESFLDTAIDYSVYMKWKRGCPRKERTPPDLGGLTLMSIAETCYQDQVLSTIT